MAFTIPYRALRAKIGQANLAQIWTSRSAASSVLCSTVLVASILLGGGTRSGFLSDTILELIAIPALLAALSGLTALPWSSGNRAAEWGVILCLGTVLLPLVQLVPLPSWIWSKLPHREQIAGIFDMLHQPLPWLPVSVAPYLTWAGLISLLPPLAIFLGVIQLDYRQRRLISLVIIAMGIFSAFLGLLQVAQGPSSPWRFYAVTNASEAVGFFANRNHLASLLYSVLMFGAAWAINVGYSIGSLREARRFEAASVVTLTGSFLALVILIAAEGSTRSRAGLGLMIVALFAALWLALSDRRRSSTSTPVKLIVGSTIVAVLLVMQFALFRIVARFEDPLQGARIPIAENTIAAAEAYMPFGSGFGTFVTVYPGFEPVKDALDNKYVNHAHDDLLEVVLEGGAMSLLMMGGFIAWFFVAAAQTWRRPPEDARGIDILLARAATFVLPLIIIHSAVDYPLRTGGMMAMFALACGFLVRPLRFEPKEIQTRLAPALEISEAEKRRLARLRGVAVAEAGAPAGLLAPVDDKEVGEGAEVAEVGMLAPGADAYEPPMDLDELAERIERDHAANARKSAISQNAVALSQHPEPANHATPELERPAARQMPTSVSTPASNAKISGEMEHTLARLNEMSQADVTGSAEVLRGTTEADRLEGEGEGSALRAAEAAERRLKILHSIKLVERPGKPAAAERVGSSAPSPSQPGATQAAATRPGTAMPRAGNAAERRKQVLRSVEQFIQSAGLASEFADGALGADAANLETSPSPVEPQESTIVVTDSVDQSMSDAAGANTRSQSQASETADLPANDRVDAESVDSSPAEEQQRTEVHRADNDDHLTNVPQPSRQPDSASEIKPAEQTRNDGADTARVLVAPSVADDAPSKEQTWANEIKWPQERKPDTSEADITASGGADSQPVAASPAIVASGNEGVTADDAVTVDDAKPASPPPQTIQQRPPEAPAPQQKVKPVPTGKALSPARGSGPVFAEVPGVPEQARWGEDIEWPDEWKK